MLRRVLSVVMGTALLLSVGGSAFASNTNGSGGDVTMFHKLGEYRKKARAWVLGDNAPKHDNCIPCDRFTDARQNLAAVASALRHFRGLERVGIPAILERVMSSAFKTALPAHVGANVATSA